MSKKLIAVASAAALALSALVGVAPAMAAPAVAFGTGAVGAGTTAASPATIAVPATNTLVTSGGAAATVTEVDLSGLATGDVVRVTATGAVRLIADIAPFSAASVNWDVSKLGTQTWDYTHPATTGTAKTIYAFTTSTTAGTIVAAVTRTGLSASSTLHLKGTAGEVYNVTNVSGVPSTLAKNATATVSFNLTDYFGNQVESVNVSGYLSASNGLATLAVPASGTTNGWDATAKNYKGTLTSLSASPFLVTITAPDNAKAGFADAKYIFSGVVNNAGVADQVAALTAQIATMRPKATSVTKKRYNKLARKWNAANPGARVALKK